MKKEDWVSQGPRASPVQAEGKNNKYMVEIVSNFALLSSPSDKDTKLVISVV